MAGKSKKISANKNIKKSEKKAETVISNNELKNLLKITLIICGVLLVFYFITILVQNKDNNVNKDSDTTAVIQYSKILAGEILNRSENEYYVLVEKEADYSSLYSPVYNYQQKGDLKLYTATLDNALNKRYLGEESNFEQRFPIFKESTLLKIKDNNIVEHYEGVEAILKIIG